MKKMNKREAIFLILFLKWVIMLVDKSYIDEV